MKSTIASIYLAAALSISGAPLLAQAWEPSGSLTLQIPFAAGGSTDTMGRVLAQAVEDVTGWNVIAENRTGGGGVAMFTGIANMPPNNQIVGFGVNEPIVVNMATRGDELSFQMDSFDYIGTVARGYLAILAAGDAPFSDMASAVQYAREHGPLAVSIEAAGQRGLIDAIAERENIEFQYVASSGAAESIRLLLGGQIQLAFASGEEIPYVRSGDVQVIASASPSRIEHSPEAMTLIESGYEVYVDPVWYLAVTAGTDEAASAAIASAFDAALADPRVVEIVRNMTQSDPVNLGPDGTRQMMTNALENALRIFGE
jgi:Uncharacterized protein conserved in bacteria